MLPYSELAVFAEVAAAQSFTAAAGRLGLSKAAVSDHVRRLEEKLGARLINRTTRRLVLTEAGRACYAHSQRMMAEADAAARIAEAHGAEAIGRLRITAPETFAPMHVAPAIARFAARHPKLDVELIVTPQKLDLLRDGIDLAIRIGVLSDSQLMTRRLAMAQLGIVAAPSYLAARGPVRATNLHEHDALQFTPFGWGDEWRMSDPNGRARRFKMRMRFACDSGEALLAAACDGLGIALLPNWITHKAVARGDLKVVMPGWGRRNMPIQVLHASEAQPPAKVRLFIEHLRKFWGDPPYWER